MTSPLFIRYITTLLLSLPMTSCMVGPNFHTPAAPNVERYTEKELPAKTVSSIGTKPSNKAQTFVNGEDIPQQWWRLFHSPAIDQLVRTGLANSPNIASAYAALHKAQETLNAQFGSSMLPAINAQDFIERERLAETTYAASKASNIFNVYYSVFNLSYTPDAFGGARREIESLRAQVDFQRFELIAAYLTLSSNIVITAINIASFQAQIDATIYLIKAQQGLFTVLEQQYQLGGISQESVLVQQTLLEQTKATLPPLQKKLSLSKHALSVLIGKFPNTIMPVINIDTLDLPDNIPVSLPSNLVRQRPDVLASEAMLHSACAQVGVATANLLPQFTITGTYGWTSNTWPHLFNPANSIWDLMGQLGQPIFQGGALLAQRRGAIAAYEQTVAQYRQAVLQAFQNVADSLRALETDARSLQAQIRAERSALSSLDLAKNQYQLGAVSYINLLYTQQQYEQVLIARIQAQASRYTDTVALFQALGGGWWNKKGESAFPTT